MRKYGYARLYRLCREWRLEHPSSHEQAVIEILTGLDLVQGRDYEREYEVTEFLSVDFGFAASRQAIEVQGKVHFDPLFDDERYPGTRAANDADKLHQLRRLEWQVLVLDYRETRRWQGQVTHFLLGGE